jgi:hypothetical protein
MALGNMSPNQDWQSLGAGGLNGYNNQGDYGGPSVRSNLDFQRLGVGRVPSAEYPDGYLGSLTTRRRDDRLLDSLKNNLNKKAYQRGVHKGERIEASQYYWPSELQPTRGISRQMKSKMDVSTGVVVYYSERNRPEVELTPAPHLVNDGKTNKRADEPGALYAKANNSRLINMRPAWR